MLNQPKITSKKLFAAGCIIGAAIFLLIFTAAPLNVTDDSWLRTGFVEKDLIQHYTGWLFYRESALTFPLGMADNFNYPYGCTVTFTDSIPLFAIFFRLIEGVLPETFQYFGLFALVCYMLQGGAAALLLSLFTQKKTALFCGTALFICNPVLIERTFRHTALSAQWLIVFALYLYFKNKKQGFAFRWGYLALLGLGIAIHPYFIPMLFGILFADLLEHCLRTKDYAKSALFLAAGFAVVLGIGWAIGIFAVPASGETLVGYGFFGMNLNSLWTPVSAGGLLWSSVLPAQNQGLGTYEGFNYLGLAVLCAAPLCAIAFCRKQKWAGICTALKTHCGLCFVCTCLTLFALSNTWVANIRVLFSIPLPSVLQSLCDTFRASGRMFWPVYYLIFLFVVVSLAQIGEAKHACAVAQAKPDAAQSDAANTAPSNAPTAAPDCAPDTEPAIAQNGAITSAKKSPCTLSLSQKALARVGCVLLCLLLFVQVFDMRDVLLEKRSFFTDPTPTYETERTDPLWDVMAETYDHLFSLDDYLYDATDIALYAASNGLTTNDGFTARFDTNTHAQDIEEELERLANGEISEGTFYLTSDESTFAYVAHKTQGLTYAVQIDWEWYAILPIVDGLEAPTASDTLYVYPLIPLMIPDYSDDHFTDGISNDDPSTITLPMNYFTKIYFGVATALIDQDGNYYDIIEYNYNYEDRFIITLDIEDASVLKGQYLASDQQTSRAVNPSEH